MRCAFLITIFALAGSLKAQEWKNMYRATDAKELSLIHTRLEVKFDYEKRRMPGKVWLTMSPHFYPTDSAILDAKGMLVQEVALVKGSQKIPLKYTYADSMVLRVKLDREYKKGEKAVIYIDYVARPDEIIRKGSAAIQGAKGLYFINPDGSDSAKPIQIWTQGEPESNSVWCPTVDKPNQKTTQEISMTVPAKYVSLSNGVLVKQVKNADGTRTDTWKMDLPHAPYLMFMGVGDYAIIRDKYKNIPVDYYVEKEYASVAKQIYGHTPEMMAFFGRLLGMEYPWPKYAQMTAVDYVSGAMENTTATLHGSWANQNARQLTDGNQWEPVIAHELFHQWFGDLVTMESLSNLTVNESFADYSEYLWMEYKYGRDAADRYHLNAMLGYLNNPADHSKHLVRFYYRDKEDMFDQVSYQKGGRILHMLRYELGDSAFFKGLQLYLQQNKFKAAEAHQLRLALEEVSGRDLTPFFNQWYFNSGHPEVSITYGVEGNTPFVAIEQKQKDQVFEFPIKIASYGGDGKVKLNSVVVKNKTDTFRIKAGPENIFLEADADRIMLWRKNEIKSSEAWIAQYNRKGNYISRREALAGQLSLDTLGEPTRQLMLRALKDPFHGIVAQALDYFDSYPTQLKAESDWASIEQIATKQKDRPTRAAAIAVLSKRRPNPYGAIFKSAVFDSSYTVAGTALEALTELDTEQAIALKGKLEEDAKGLLEEALENLKIVMCSEDAADSLIAAFKKLPGIQRLTAVKGMLLYAAKIKNPATFKNVVAPVMDLYRRIPAGFGTYKADMMGQLKDLLGKKEMKMQKTPGNEELKEQVDWLKQQLL